MNIGIRLHDVAGSSLEERLQAAKRQGFTCAHVALSKTVPGFSMKNAPTLIDGALTDMLRTLFAKYGIQCAVLGCYLNPGTPDEEEWQNSLKCYQAHLRLASALGVRVVGTETGAPNTAYKTCPECDTEESLQLFIRRITPLVRYAEEAGANIAIEPVCRHIVNTAEKAQRVLETIDSPNLKIILDAVNLLSPANQSRADGIIQDALNRLGDQIFVLHMKDYLVIDGVTDVEATACGRGLMHYDSLLRFAKAHPDIPMTLENTNTDTAEAARLHLEKLAQAL